LRDSIIRTNGDVEVCFYHTAIGNIKEQSAREIWYGTKADEIWRQTVECERLRFYSSHSQKKLTDNVSGLTILTHQMRRHAREDHVESITPVGSAA
jgi:hypothetical protein